MIALAHLQMKSTEIHKIHVPGIVTKYETAKKATPVNVTLVKVTPVKATPVKQSPKIEEQKDQPFYLHYCSTLLHGPNGEWFKSMMEKELASGEGFLKKPLNLIDRKSVWERI